jgi:hypothetical protein
VQAFTGRRVEGIIVTWSCVGALGIISTLYDPLRHALEIKAA